MRLTKKHFLRILLAGGGAALLLTAWITVQDYRVNQATPTFHSQIPNATVTGEVEILERLTGGGSVAVDDLAKVVAFVKGRNDCSDFRIITLLRVVYSQQGKLTPEVEKTIRELILGFRYWMDEPGDSPLFWGSENHQITAAAAEFLAGQRYPDATFGDGRRGAEHRVAARERILFWLEQRWRFGFTEWNSHYYINDIVPLSNLVDFAQDEEIVRKSTIVMDLLFFDMATQSFRGTFITTSGRLYENNKKFGDRGIRRIMQHAFFPAEESTGPTGIEVNYLRSSYVVPPVLQAIARDASDTIVRASTGRDLDELASDGTLLTEDRRIMALWGMEAFTNPQAIDVSLGYIRKHELFANEDLAPFKQLNYRALIATGALPVISRALDLPTNGLLLGHANTYTFRTPDYAMYTTQAYRPGEPGNQHHVFGMTFADGVTLFHTHPAVRPGDGKSPGYRQSPGYWTGTGFLPLSCQEGRVNISMYKLPKRPGYGRRYLLDFTHLYAPLSRFDRVSLDGNRLLLQYKEALVAVTAATPLEQVGDSEIIQRGRDTVWVTEASSTREETFAAFADRMRKATVDSDGRTSHYTSGGKTYSASFKTGCALDGVPLRTSYEKSESKYARVKREPTEFRIEFDGHSLLLDFGKMIREFR